MKPTIVLIALGLLTWSAAAASPKDDLQNAIKKLSDSGNYSWKSTSANAGGGGGGGGGRGGGPSEGKMADGVVCIVTTRQDTTTETFLKGDKGAIKTDEGWRSLAELTADTGGDPNPNAFRARAMRTFKAPAAQAADILASVKELKSADGVYSGDLTTEGVQRLLTFGGGRRGGADAPPPPANAKGSAKFWVKDGAISKYEFNVRATITFNGEDREINRTTTIEIKDVGATKVQVPDDAKKKLS